MNNTVKCVICQKYFEKRRRASYIIRPGIHSWGSCEGKFSVWSSLLSHLNAAGSSLSLPSPSQLLSVTGEEAGSGGRGEGGYHPGEKGNDTGD